MKEATKTAKIRAAARKRAAQKAAARVAATGPVGDAIRYACEDCDLVFLVPADAPTRPEEYEEMPDPDAYGLFCPWCMGWSQPLPHAHGSDGKS